MLITKPGSGTYVRGTRRRLNRLSRGRYGGAPRLPRRPRRPVPPAARAGSAGRPAPPEVADAFGVRDGTELLVRRHLVRTDDAPVEVGASWFRVADAAGTSLERYEAFGRPLYQEAEEAIGRRYASATDTISARQPSREEAEILQIRPDTPVLHLLHVAFDAPAQADRGGPGDLARPDDHAHRGVPDPRRRPPNPTRTPVWSWADPARRRRPPVTAARRRLAAGRRRSSSSSTWSSSSRSPRSPTCCSSTSTCAASPRPPSCWLAVWWGWLTTTWLTSWFDPRHMLIALLLIGTMLVSLVMSMAIPEAFGDQALTFAIAYVVIQLGRSVILLGALGRGHPLKITFRRVLAWASVGAVFWVAGALAGGTPSSRSGRSRCWSTTCRRSSGSASRGWAAPPAMEWAIEGAHFAERCQLLVIVALGESILVIGATAVGTEVTAGTVTAFVLAFLTSVTLWWLYFANSAEAGAMALARADDPGRFALTYDHYHLIMIAGIIATAVGDELVISHPGEAATWAEAAALVGGPMLYLIGNNLLNRSLSGRMPPSRIASVAALAAVILLTPLGPPSLLAGGGLDRGAGRRRRVAEVVGGPAGPSTACPGAPVPARGGRRAGRRRSRPPGPAPRRRRRRRRAPRRPRRRPGQRPGRVEVVGQRARVPPASSSAPDGPDGGRGGRAATGPAAAAPVLSSVVGPLPVGAVVVGDQRQPHRHRVDAVGRAAGTRRPGCPGLGHLLAVQPDHAGVHVVRGERRRAGEHLGVRGGALVVREEQVVAAALHVDRVAEQVQRDHRALDVPAGAARARARRRPRPARRRGRRATAAGRAGRACRPAPGRRRARRSSASICVAGQVGLVAEPRRGGDRRSRRRRCRRRAGTPRRRRAGRPPGRRSPGSTRPRRRSAPAG